MEYRNRSADFVLCHKLLEYTDRVVLWQFQLYLIDCLAGFHRFDRDQVNLVWDLCNENFNDERIFV